MPEPADGVEHVLGAGIHGLSSLDEVIHVQSLKNLIESVSHRNRDKAHFLQGRLRLPGLLLLLRQLLRVFYNSFVMLFPHIIDFHAGQGAESQRLWMARPGSLVCTCTLTISSSATSTTESPIDIRYSLNPCSSASVSALVSRIINSVQYPYFMSASASGTEPEISAGFFSVEGTEKSRGIPCRERVAGSPPAPSPDPGRRNPRLLPLLRQGSISGVCSSTCLACSRTCPRNSESSMSSSESCAAFSATPLGHRKDSSFLWLHNRLVSGLHSFWAAAASSLGINFFLIPNGFGKSPKKLRQNHAGISSGPPQGTGRNSLGQIFDCDLVKLLNLLDRGHNGHSHVGSRVPVGYGKNIQFIDPFFFLIPDFLLLPETFWQAGQHLSCLLTQQVSSSKTQSITRTPSTRMRTRSTSIPVNDSSLYFTFPIRLSATAEILTPYATMT